jgi:putative membrane protein
MFRLRILALGLASMAASGQARAHDGHDHPATPGWTLDPWIIIPLALVLVAFIVGRQRLARRSKIARAGGGWFLAGWLVLTIALVSPLHERGERSFTVHMVEHELIMLVATLLMSVTAVGGMLAWGLPDRLRQELGGRWKTPFAALWRRLTEPLTATIVQALALWAWHAPALFDRALQSPGWHAAQHLSFIIASLAFWRAMLDIRRDRELLGAVCLFLTSLVEGALGALMALSSSAWYARYAAMGLTGIGLDPVTDQQLAGLLMWIPGGLVHGAAALVLLHRWLSKSGERHAFSAE